MNLQQYDELTGLEKRESALRKIKILISENKEFHIIFVDIDFFKSINDNFGHKRGDEILKDTADFLKQLVDKDETVSRWGGDEFLIVLNNNPIKFTDRIMELLTSKKFKGEPELSISLSFGTASYPEDGTNFEDLYDTADRRMYDFKKRRRWKGKIIGRKEELLKIRKLLDKVSSNNSLLCNIYGDDGVGKTRLIQEASVYAQIIGFNVKIIDGKKRDEFFKFLEGQSFYNVEESFLMKIKELIENKFQLFVIDNIDFFPEIIDIIKNLIKKTSKTLFLTSSLKKLNDFLNIKIENLDVYETGELIEEMLGSRNFKTDFINFVFKETNGNPEKIIKMVKHFINTGKIENINFEEYNFIDDVIKDFNERFNDDEKNILKISTILGDNFEPKIVADVTETNEIYVLSVLEKAENSGIMIKKIKDLLEEDAQKYYRKLAEYFSRNGNKKISGDFYNKAGMIKEAHIEYLEFLEESLCRFLPKEYENVLNELEKYENEEWFLKKSFYLKKADYYYRIGELNNSLKYLDKALDLEPDKETMLKKSKILAKLGEMKKAYDTLNLVGNIGLPFLSEIFIKIGDIERAYINAKKAVENLKEPEYLMEAYAALGGVNIKLRDYDKGLKNLEKALIIANYMDNRHWISLINNRIAAIFFLRADYTTSRIYYEKALHGFKCIGDIYSVINVYINLGLVYEKQGDLIGAMNLYIDALRLSKELAFAYLEGEALGSIGRIHSIKGDYRKAIEYFINAIEIMKKIKSLEELLEFYFEIAMAYLRLKEITNAVEYIKKAKKLAEELKTERLKKKIVILEAYYHILNGKPKIALRLLQNIKNTQFQELKGDILINLALAYDKLNDTRNARLYATKALKFCKENCSLLEISSCYDKLSGMKTFEKEIEQLKKISMEIRRRLKVNEI